MMGFGRERYGGFDIFVAETERLFLDCLSRNQVPVAELGDLISAVDVETDTRYAERMKTNAVKKRMGYLLEVLRGESVESL